MFKLSEPVDQGRPHWNVNWWEVCLLIAYHHPPLESDWAA